METTTVKLYSFTYKEAKTYLFALLFIVGNIALPQICHLVPGGGLTWLPIYFFTLIAAYKYGLRVGLLTAILSPLVNNLLFGMPAIDILPAILIKSTLLAGAAAYAAHRLQKISLLGIIAAVLAYQVIGTLIEWAIVRDFIVAIQDFRIGIPGMLVQIFGGYALLKAIAKI
ncbi:MAG: ECF transporter S component [Prevotella sp.]|nr:ECF transporter S component [Prevotella sp.]